MCVLFVRSCSKFYIKIDKMFVELVDGLFRVLLSISYLVLSPLVYLSRCIRPDVLSYTARRLSSYTLSV